jgi:hypothetical protein
MPDFCQSLVTRLESSELLPHAIDQLTVNERLVMAKRVMDFNNKYGEIYGDDLTRQIFTRYGLNMIES